MTLLRHKYSSISFCSSFHFFFSHGNKKGRGEGEAIGRSGREERGDAVKRKKRKRGEEKGSKSMKEASGCGQGLANAFHKLKC